MSGSSSYAATVDRPEGGIAAAAPAPLTVVSDDRGAAADRMASGHEAVAPALPDYLQNTYSWAYLNPFSRALLDQSFIVSTILWGNAKRLVRSVLSEIEPGQKVLQTACVYGDFSAQVAEHLGPDARFEVIDVAPIQVLHCRRKLRHFPQATVRLADAADPGGGPYDVVCCFFLLHEVPDTYKNRIVDALLDRVEPGGKVVFVDYHRPHSAHPLKGLMKLVFALLEPYAKEIWEREIQSYATDADAFTWTKATYFGDLYQRVVALRKPLPAAE